MTTFFLDLWHDLREKRLWPVAAGLALAILAVPIVLMKSSSAPSTGSTPPVQAKGARLPAVNLDQSSVASSHLDLFKEKNPFKDFADKTGSPLGVSGTTTGASSPLGTAAAGNVSTAGKSGSAGGGSSSSGSGGGSSSGGGSGGGSSTPSGPSGTPVTPGLHYFIFTADVRFGSSGHAHTYKGIKQLDVLPPDKHPVLVFMGVRDGGKTAVFFNPKGMTAAGEGKCVADCEFIYMKKDQEETLVSGSTAYTLKVLAVHAREVSKDEATGGTTPSKKVSAADAKKREERTLLSVPGLALKR